MTSAGPGGTVSKRSCQVGLDVAEPGGLLGAQGFARLDQMQVDGIAKVRHRPCGTQRIGEQRAAARTELDHAHTPGPAHGLPYRRAPEADQLAEHLAHLGRGV